MHFNLGNSIKGLLALTIGFSIISCQNGTNNNTSSTTMNPDTNKIIFLSSAVNGRFLQGISPNQFCARDTNNPQPDKKWGVAVAPFDKIFIMDESYSIYNNKIQVGTWMASSPSFLDAKRAQLLNYFISTDAGSPTMNIWFGSLSGLTSCYVWRDNSNNIDGSIAAYNYATQNWSFVGKNLSCDNLAHVLCVEQE